MAEVGPIFQGGEREEGRVRGRLKKKGEGGGEQEELAHIGGGIE